MVHTSISLQLRNETRLQTDHHTLKGRSNMLSDAEKREPNPIHDHGAEPLLAQYKLYAPMSPQRDYGILSPNPSSSHATPTARY
ncbi:hypothetical protein VTI74DRAFT_225 [Chaetomium olivicolor]